MIASREPLRVGFLGCGLIARSHVRGLAATTRAAVGPVYDPDGERAVAFASETGGHPAASVAEVIEASDAVYVCTWTSEHLHLVRQVVAAGKAVFCEKPLATDLASAAELHDVVVASGVTNQVGLVLRRSPAFRWLQHSMTGDVMNIVFRDDQYIPIQGMYGSTWRGDPAKAGAGTLLEHSIHDLDLLDWMMGPITSVSARVGHTHDLVGIDDQATVTLTNDSGTQAVLISVWHDILSRPSQRRVEVFCRERLLTLTGDWNGPVTIEDADSTAGPAEGQALAAAAHAVDGLTTNPDVAFVEAVLDGVPAYPDTAIALRAHVLADAAYRSAADGGAPVKVVCPTE